MPIYGEGECLYGVIEECRLGDKGIEVNPIYCLNCVLLKLANVIEVLIEGRIPPEEDPNEAQLRG